MNKKGFLPGDKVTVLYVPVQGSLLATPYIPGGQWRTTVRSVCADAVEVEGCYKGTWIGNEYVFYGHGVEIKVVGEKIPERAAE